MKKLKITILSFFLFLLAPYFVDAASANLGLSGNSTVAPGTSFSLNVVVSNISGSNIIGVGGGISSTNASCVKIESIAKVSPSSGQGAGNFYYSDADGTMNTFTIVKVNLKAISQSCTANINITGGTLSFANGEDKNLSTISKKITVTAPLSTNNNLASLTVNQGSLSPAFSASNLNYTVNVGSNVSSITINATAADAKATVSGAGTKNLSYGTNKFTIVVKAENGGTKNYIINVNREDDRASDAKLKSLTVNGGSLSPSFDPNKTSYTLSVPYEISKLNINASASDDKSKVSIHNPDLVAEGTTTVTIKVTAENGATKTYTIKVTRGKDPNKVLSTDNKLLSLVPSIGILSPVFDSNKTNYYIYLPYEIDSINFTYEVSDKKYATVKEEKINVLVADSPNKFTFTVTAEDNSTKTYSVTVYRAKNHDLEATTMGIEENTNGIQLKSINLKNGKLSEKFTSNKTKYNYSKKKDFSYSYETMDENSTVKVIEKDNSIYFIVIAEDGSMGVYCLHEKKNNILVIILILLIILLIGTVTYILIKKNTKTKAVLPRNAKAKNDNSNKKSKKKLTNSKK